MERIDSRSICQTYKSDSRGQCDGCQREPVNLATEWDSEEGWQYCKRCWQHYRKAYQRGDYR